MPLCAGMVSFMHFEIDNCFLEPNFLLLAKEMCSYCFYLFIKDLEHPLLVTLCPSFIFFFLFLFNFFNVMDDVVDIVKSHKKKHNNIWFYFIMSWSANLWLKTV
jgi:hypothetical protein